jgi:hypothetical protein
MEDSRIRYNEETFRTIPLIEGKTIKSVLTTSNIKTHETTGLRLVFTDGTEATITQPDNAPVDLARSRGLYP